MKMMRDLTDEEIKEIVATEMVSVSPTDALQLARALLEAAWIKSQVQE